MSGEQDGGNENFKPKMIFFQGSIDLIKKNIILIFDECTYLETFGVYLKFNVTLI